MRNMVSLLTLSRSVYLLLNSYILASSIIRISPNHVHINDPEFQNEYVDRLLSLSCIVSVRKKLSPHRVFSSRSEFYKAPYLYDGFGAPGSILSMTDPHVHKIRRNLLNPLFSARATEGFSLRTTRRVQRALEIAVADAQAGKPINIEQLFRGIMVSVSCRFSSRSF